jgi:hypothetical protein
VVPVEGALVRGWWDETDVAVQASVVEPVDGLGDGDLEVLDALPRAPRLRTSSDSNSELSASARALS